MTAPKTYIGTAPQHWFSKSWWSQHSETAFKVRLPFHVFVLLKFPNPVPRQPTIWIPIQVLATWCKHVLIHDRTVGYLQTIPEKWHLKWYTNQNVLDLGQKKQFFNFVFFSVSVLTLCQLCDVALSAVKKCDNILSLLPRKHPKDYKVCAPFDPNLVGDKIGSIWITLRPLVSQSVCQSVSHTSVSAITWAVFNAGSPNWVQRCPRVISSLSLKMDYIYLFLDLKNRSPKMFV